MARIPANNSDALRDSNPARAGVDPERARLEARGRELDQLMLEAIQRRTELDERERRLGDRRADLDRQRTDIDADRARIESQTKSLRDEHQTALQDIAKRMEAIRKHERELERRTALARDEALRDRVEADAARLAAHEQSQQSLEERRRIAAERQELSARQDALSTRERTVEQRATEFEEFARDVRTTAEAFERRQAELDRRAAELESAAQRVDRQTAALRLEHESALQEVARRVEAVRGQERELERRAALARDELTKQRAEVETLRRDAEQQAARTQAGHEELSAILAKLAERAAELDVREVAETRRAEEFSRRERDVNATSAGLDQRRWKLAEREAELGSAGERLARRESELASQNQQLEQRLRKARDEVVHERREVEGLMRSAREQHEAAAAENALARAEREQVGRDATALEALRGEAAQKEQRLRQIDSEHQRQRDELAGEREKLTDDQRSLKASRKALEDKRRDQDKRESALLESAAKIDRSIEELARRRVDLERERSESTDRRREIERHAEALAQRDADLAESERVRRRAAEDFERERSAEKARLDDRRNELAEWERRLADQGLAAQARQAELDTVRDQIDIRDAESSQRALALEVRTDELDRRQAVVDLAEEDMLARRSEREAEFERLEQEIRGRQQVVEAAESSMLTAPKRWPLRAAGIASVAAVFAAVLWLNWERPVFRSRVRFAFQTDTPLVERTLRAHASALVSPEALSAWLPEESVRREWSSASAEGSATAWIVIDPPSVEVRLDAKNAARARSLVETVAGHYVEAVNGVTPAALLPAVYADIQQRRDVAAAELKQMRERLHESNTMLSLCPPASRREELAAQVLAMRREYDETVRALDERRAALELVRRGESVGGMVTDEQVRAALREDPIYSADVEERSADATAFRSELMIAMAPVSERSTELERTIAAAREVVSQQREQNPPASASAVLERFASDLGDLASRTSAFSRKWSELRARAKAATVEGDLKALFEVASDASGECEGLVAGARGQLENAGPNNVSTNGEGGTRETVLLNAARAELTRVEAAVEEFSRAATGVDRRHSVRLAGHDSRLRGVDSRMSRRQSMVRERLQAAADQAAADAREVTTTRMAAEVASLELRRDGMNSRLGDAMDALRGLDDDVLERRKLESDIARGNEEISRLEKQVAGLDAQLERARRGGPQPDRTRIVAVEDEIVAGANRIRNAATAATTAFGGMWLLCVMMLVKNPWRRRSRSVKDAAVRAVT